MLIEGVLFRARYLGSTQLVCEGQPTKATRMMQAEEAVSRIKVIVNYCNIIDGQLILRIDTRCLDHQTVPLFEFLHAAKGIQYSAYSCSRVGIHDYDPVK